MAGKTDFKYNELIKQIIYSVKWIKQRVSTHQSQDINSNTEKLLRPSYNPSAYICSCLCVTVKCQNQIDKLF